MGAKYLLGSRIKKTNEVIIHPDNLKSLRAIAKQSHE